MLECASVITDAHGNAVKVPASNRFVIPRGFVGTWKVVETRKINVIHGHGE